MRVQLRADLRPVGALEDFLVDHLVACVWRLRRSGRAEMEVFTFRRYRDAALAAESHEAFLKEVGSEVFHGTDGPWLARALDADDRALANLARYQTSIERAIYKALHELQRVQAVRAGQPVPPPTALELTLLRR